MNLAALILAGGLSQRMGQDKALLEVGEVPLLRRTWDIAKTVTSDVWIVTPRRDRYAPLLPESAQWIDEPTPSPEVSPAGPLMAFLRGLEHLEAVDWILLLACDLPNLSGHVLNQWRSELPQLSPKTLAYVPRTEAGWEPLCGFYRTACLSSLQTYVASGKRAFQTWLDQLPATSIPQVPDEMLLNCNTPDDWDQTQ